jgi:hypothetical protein
LRHGALWITTGNSLKSLPRILVLERVQQGDGSIEILLHCLVARSGEVYGPDFFFTQLVMMTFISDGRQGKTKHHKQGDGTHTPPKQCEEVQPEEVGLF